MLTLGTFSEFNDPSYNRGTDHSHYQGRSRHWHQTRSRACRHTTPQSIALSLITYHHHFISVVVVFYDNIIALVKERITQLLIVSHGCQDIVV